MYGDVLEGLLKDFTAFLSLERSLSDNSIAAYTADVRKFFDYLEKNTTITAIAGIDSVVAEAFLLHLNDLGIAANSQARTLSGLKTFYKFLLVEELIANNPLQLVETPKLQRKIPEVLSVAEIEAIFKAIDHSTPEGMRNRAIVEVLYGSGLRVSELINIQLSNLFLDIGFIRIIGKGNKERLAPINPSAIQQVKWYCSTIRPQMPIQKDSTDILFLNRRGHGLTRVMVFYIVREAARAAGITKTVSPHAFRHSFATHLYDGGADLRAIQALLGHESITTTEIYTKVDSQYLRDTVLRFHPRSQYHIPR